MRPVDKGNVVELAKYEDAKPDLIARLGSSVLGQEKASASPQQLHIEHIRGPKRLTPYWSGLGKTSH